MSDDRPTPPDQAEGAPHPRETFALIGRETEESTVRRAAFGARAPHAWLFEGPEGVGKATLAYRLARALLSTAPRPGACNIAVDRDDDAAKLIMSQGHPDLYALSPPWDEKRGKHRAEIPVEAVRQACGALFRTPSMSDHRVLIVDAIDQLGRGGADALLKTLEEPRDRTTLILISHRPARLSPTIRSRCRRLRFTPLTEEATCAVLSQVVELSNEDAEKGARAFPGSPGAAIRRLGAAKAVEAANRLLSAPLGGRDWNLALASLLDDVADRHHGVVALESAAATLSNAVRAAVRAGDMQKGRTGAPAAGMDMNAATGLWRALNAVPDRVARLNLDRRGGVLEIANLITRAHEGALID